MKFELIAFNLVCFTSFQGDRHSDAWLHPPTEGAAHQVEPLATQVIHGYPLDGL